MTLDFIIVIALSILGLLAHASRQQPWLSWILRIVIGIFIGGEAISALGWVVGESGTAWGLRVLLIMCISSLAGLFLPARQVLSYLLTIIESLMSGQFFLKVRQKQKIGEALLLERVFVPESMPHLVALWIYITSACFLLGSIEPSSFKMPAMPLAIPVPIDQLFSYNGLGLVLLASCGVGIFVARRPKEVLGRLGWVKPTLPQALVGVALIFVTFAYDAVWSMFTHNMGGDLGSLLAGYNSGTFTAGGAPGSASGIGPSLILALATGLFAGIGEETLIRGALQPVFGILPSAVLHGLLHGQFNHAPIFVVQVIGWSAIMGIVKRYTNTTTTIIGHAGFNFLTTFLFAFNP